MNGTSKLDVNSIEREQVSCFERDLYEGLMRERVQHNFSYGMNEKNENERKTLLPNRREQYFPPDLFLESFFMGELKLFFVAIQSVLLQLKRLYFLWTTITFVGFFILLLLLLSLMYKFYV